MMQTDHRHARRAAGFTLIELMIAVAIVAILASIAIPSYTQHIRKARRAAAQSFMMDVANREEQMMLDQRSYVAVANNAAFSTAPPTGLNMTVPGSGSDVDVADYYTLSVAIGAAPPTYVITATPVGDQANDKASGTTCSPLTLDNTGSKGTTTAVCWSQ